MTNFFRFLSQGIAFPSDRSELPGKCNYIPRQQGDIKPVDGLTYAMIDQAVEDGLVRISEDGYRPAEFRNVLWTPKGREAYLLEIGFDLEGWRSRWKNHSKYPLCCLKAVPTFCVCWYRSICSGHGSKCHGSHD